MRFEQFRSGTPNSEIVLPMQQQSSGLPAQRHGKKVTRYGSSLRKAVQMLDAFEPTVELGASELAVVIGADRSTAFRLAQALTQFGWLRQDPETRRYRPGIRLWELGARAISDVDVRRAAHPYMQHLALSTGESSDLGILESADVVYIERVDGSQWVRVCSRVGMRIPAHAIAMGKVLLAFLPAEDRHARLRHPLQQFTPRTVTREDDLDRQCEKVLTDLYAVNQGEWRSDAGGIAAPVFDRLGRCVAAISIDLPVARITPASIAELAPLVKQAAARASHDSGADLSEVGYSLA